MKFSCDKHNLEKFLSIAERFTGKNITLPILGNILLENSGDFLIITATNLEYAVQIKFKVSNHKEGKICIQAKIINSLVQSLKEDKIEIEEKNNNLILKTSTREARLNGITSEDFPLLPSIKGNINLNIRSLSLKRGLERVYPSISNSEFKPEFTGILFDFNLGSLKLVATDTFRLAENKTNFDFKKDKICPSFIIPQNIAQELIRIIDEDGDMSIMLGDNQIIFSFKEIKIISRLIDGSFPDYSNIIPKNFETSIFVNKNEFKDIIKTSSIFASKLMDVTLEIQDKGIKISSLNSEVGEYKTFLPAKISLNIDKPVKLSFNYKYLLDGLNSLDEDEVFLGCNTENKPSLLHNKSNTNFLYVLMPIKIS